MSGALEAAGGHYAQFTGDGLLALYGLETDIGPACTPMPMRSGAAAGDTINAAARLESLTKDYGCTLVVSLDTLRFAGIAAPDVGLRQVEVRGRAGRLEVLPIEDPGTLLVPADQ
jgi:adenylate cyclase